MPWVKFTRDFPWIPTKGVTILFKKDSQQLVTTPCASAAVMVKAAERIKNPNASQNPQSGPAEPEAG